MELSDSEGHRTERIRKFMKTQFKYLFMVLAVLPLAIFNLQLSIAFGQGALTPPGAPATTMKTLDQVEPRTPEKLSDEEAKLFQPLGGYFEMEPLSF